jgi:hypothetical protein
METTKETYEIVHCSNCLESWTEIWQEDNVLFDDSKGHWANYDMKIEFRRLTDGEYSDLIYKLQTTGKL